MSKPFDMKPLLLLASIVRSDMIGSAVTCELCWWIFGNGMVVSYADGFGTRDISNPHTSHK
ncbi:hypothetical protein QF020_000903 [Pseudomonas frederiksbergensis]